MANNKNQDEYPDSVRQRFWDKVKKGEGCWEWQASKFRTGYGKFKLNYRSRTTHRVSYELFNGPIPDGQLVCHTCDNRTCVNPDHLYLGTHKDNVADMIRRGRSPLKSNAGLILKTHCKRGHELSGDNLVKVAHNRQCRICKNARQRKCRIF